MPKIPQNNDDDAAGPERFAAAIAGLAVPIASVQFDPQNARRHPARNLEAIQASLTRYGQLKPIVVRAGLRTIVAGNGTLAAALALGWQRIAVVVQEMTDAEAAGFGLADNRTAELAEWDFEMVAKAEKFLREMGNSTIGWTSDELEVLRAADWSPPAIDGTEYNGWKVRRESVSFSDIQWEEVESAVQQLQERSVEATDYSLPDCLSIICREWKERNDAEDASSGL